MKIYDLILAMQSAVANDAELSAMATTWYGRQHRAFIDQDVDNPPGEDDCPIIQFHSPEKQASEESRTVTYGFYLNVQVCDAEDATRVEDNVQEFAATRRLAEFVERIVAVIRISGPGDYSMAYDFATDTISHFPVFVADVFISITERLVIGQDPLN